MTATTTVSPAPTDSPAKRTIKSLEFGLQSALRLGKTLGVIYPRAALWLLARRQPTPREVRETFEALGTTYIKLGQFIASAPSIFPEEYVEEFQHCLDQTKPIAFAEIVRTIEQDLGGPIDQLFRDIDPEPLASASIAQVHAATLKNGDNVVVKVQKPGVENILATDLNFVFVMSRLTELLTPGLSKETVSGFISEIYQYMLDECDFIKEANNLVTFKEFLDRTGNTQVVVPKPYMDLSGQKVLTMERLYGVGLGNYEDLKQHTEQPGDVLITAMNTWFASVMDCEFFHADLHSGNLMLLEDGRIGFIDFGMIGRIKRESWQAMFSLFDGLDRGNYRQIAEAMLTVGMTDKQVDLDELTNDIKHMFQVVQGFDPDQVENISEDINQLIVDLGQIGRKHGVRFPHAFTLLIKQFLYFDRYIELLAPEIHMFEDDRIRMV